MSFLYQPQRASGPASISTASTTTPSRGPWPVPSPATKAVTSAPPIPARQSAGPTNKAVAESTKVTTILYKETNMCSTGSRAYDFLHAITAKLHVNTGHVETDAEAQRHEYFERREDDEYFAAKPKRQHDPCQHRRDNLVKVNCTEPDAEPDPGIQSAEGPIVQQPQPTKALGEEENGPARAPA